MVVTFVSRRRSAFAASLLLTLIAACEAAAPALPSVAPEDGVVVENTTASSVQVVYEHVNDDIDAITTVEPGATVVVGAMFEGVEAPCVTGRLVALDDADAEVDELYYVCRGKTWAIEGS